MRQFRGNSLLTSALLSAQKRECRSNKSEIFSDLCLLTAFLAYGSAVVFITYKARSMENPISYIAEHNRFMVHSWSKSSSMKSRDEPQEFSRKP